MTLPLHALAITPTIWSTESSYDCFTTSHATKETIFAALDQTGNPTTSLYHGWFSHAYLLALTSKISEEALGDLQPHFQFDPRCTNSLTWLKSVHDACSDCTDVDTATVASWFGEFMEPTLRGAFSRFDQATAADEGYKAHLLETLSKKELQLAFNEIRDSVADQARVLGLLHANSST